LWMQFLLTVRLTETLGSQSADSLVLLTYLERIERLGQRLRFQLIRRLIHLLVSCGKISRKEKTAAQKKLLGL